MTHRTVFHEAFEHYEKSTAPLAKKVMMWVGIGLLSLVFLSVGGEIIKEIFGFEHTHMSVLWISFIIVVFLMGFTLVTPKTALQLISIMPLPPFLRRNGVLAYRGPERRDDNQGPPAGTSERRSRVSGH